MTLLWAAFGLLIAWKYPGLFWPIAILVLLMDLEDRKKRTG